MCGIVAIFSSDNTVSYRNLTKGINALVHRGPDSNGSWISKMNKIGLGHTRLSIIDLKTGFQPLKSSDNTIHLVVNGELYGYKDIRKDLIEKGYKFRSNSDSEIIIALYQEYGSSLFSYLRGEFSFILWDERKQSLLVARDRFGIKPLFYAKYKNTLYFASEIKALIAMGVDARWNWDTVLQAETETQPPTQTMFKGVRSISPGHFACVKNGIINECCYWDLKYTKKSSLIQTSDIECIEEFSSIFEEAVRLRLCSDVPVGCYLSGGLDSCSILGTMAKICDKPIDAFTLLFTEEPDYNEVNEAAEMARLAGASHYEIPIDFQAIADNFFETVWYNESSIANTSPVAKFILSQEVNKAGYKVVLTGEGADEMFAGYAPFYYELIEGNNTQNINPVAMNLPKSKKANSIYNTLFDDSLDFSYIKSKVGFIPFYFKSFCSRDGQFKALRKEELSNLASKQIFGKHLLEALNLEHLKGVNQLNKTLYLWSKTMLPNVMLSAMGDRMEMSHSVEARVPFLDHKLAEFSTNLPINMKIRGLIEKYIIRNSCKNILTKTVYQRQKHPFVAPPIIYTKNNPMWNLMRETFHSSLLSNLPFYKQNSVIKLLENVSNVPINQRPTVDMILTHILSLCVLQSKFSMLS